jgi:hypothetical protein
VTGTGFTSPKCTVSIPMVGELGPYMKTGNIVTGIAIGTPCVNTGQTIQITVTNVADPNEYVMFTAQCPMAQ